jgi:putative ABC transport system ATP-binding protein
MARLRNRDIGFVFQSFQLLPRLSALENVMLPLIYAKVPRKRRLERARAELARVGLSDKEGNLPRQLSGGQQQRVAIARALVTRPRILLADEPTGALDRATGAQIMDIFRSLNEEGITVVMITHDRKIASYAGRTVYILDGRMYSAEEYLAQTEG